MRVPATLLFLTVVLVATGCATIQRGNFTEQLPIAVETTIADDVHGRLTTLFPPAQTSFVIRQEIKDTDNFGKRLINSLRESGYGVHEAAHSSPPPSSASLGLPLSYVVDHTDGMVRVTIHVADESLTRAYLTTAGTAQPATVWARKEETKEETHER